MRYVNYLNLFYPDKQIIILNNSILNMVDFYDIIVYV